LFLSLLFFKLQTSASSVPPALKRQSINLHHKLNRAQEEQSIVRREMVRYSEYIINEHSILHAALTNSDENSPQFKLVRAASGLICKKLVELEFKYREACCLFKSYLNNMPPLSVSISALIDSFDDEAVVEQSMQSTVSDVEDDISDSEEYDEHLDQQ